MPFRNGTWVAEVGPVWSEITPSLIVPLLLPLLPLLPLELLLLPLELLLLEPQAPRATAHAPTNTTQRRLRAEKAKTGRRPVLPIRSLRRPRRDPGSARSRARDPNCESCIACPLLHLDLRWPPSTSTNLGGSYITFDAAVHSRRRCPPPVVHAARVLFAASLFLPYGRLGESGYVSPSRMSSRDPPGKSTPRMASFSATAATTRRARLRLDTRAGSVGRFLTADSRSPLRHPESAPTYQRRTTKHLFGRAGRIYQPVPTASTSRAIGITLSSRRETRVVRGRSERAREAEAARRSCCAPSRW